VTRVGAFIDQRNSIDELSQMHQFRVVMCMAGPRARAAGSGRDGFDPLNSSIGLNAGFVSGRGQGHRLAGQCRVGLWPCPQWPVS
jgi:hypothetical protein